MAGVLVEEASDALPVDRESELDGLLREELVDALAEELAAAREPIGPSIVASVADVVAFGLADCGDPTAWAGASAVTRIELASPSVATCIKKRSPQPEHLGLYFPAFGESTRRDF
jgi:hypothetical protein